MKKSKYIIKGNPPALYVKVTGEKPRKISDMGGLTFGDKDIILRLLNAEIPSE
jgi:hypothetical protein